MRRILASYANDLSTIARWRARREAARAEAAARAELAARARAQLLRQVAQIHRDRQEATLRHLQGNRSE
jgi:hypothetical protein